MKTGHSWLDEGFLTTVEASAILCGVIPLEIRQWCHKGIIRYTKEDGTGRYLICETDIRGLADYCKGRPATLNMADSWKHDTQPDH